MGNRFDVIYADPPWHYNDKGQSGSCTNSGSEVNYSVMKPADIMALPVTNVAASTSVCVMWVTGPMMDVGLKVMAAWGFNYKTMFGTWVKTATTNTAEAALSRALRDRAAVRSPGIRARVVADMVGHLRPKLMWGQGSYTRANPEFILLGTRGRRALPRMNRNTHSVFTARPGKHSEKPECVAEAVQGLFGDEVRYLEMFARRKPARNGRWSFWGDEIECDMNFESRVEER